MNLFPSDSGATFSPCRRWRYQLWRIWDSNLPVMAFIGMNPSTADETENDPTVERMQRRALKWSFGGLLVGNVFAYRQTDSRLLPSYVAAGVDIIGPDNDRHLIEIGKRAGLVICGWRDVLGHDVTAANLEERYRRLRSENHPDKGGSADTFHAVQIAYEQAKQELGR